MMTPEEFGKATERYLPTLAAAAVPFYVYHSDHQHLGKLPIGTGVLFAVAKRRFIITARHIIERLTPEDRLVIANHMSNSRFTIAASSIIRGSSTDLDLMLVPLDEKDVEKLQGKTFVRLESLALTDQKDQNIFVLFGYPQQLAKQTPHEFHALFFGAQLVQGAIPQALQGFLPKYHMLLEVQDEHVRDDDGQSSTLPELPGVSGGPVWRISRQRNGEAELVGADEVRLAGIETGFYRQHSLGRTLIKMVSATALIELLSGLGDDVRDEMSRIRAGPALEK